MTRKKIKKKITQSKPSNEKSLRLDWVIGAIALCITILAIIIRIHSFVTPINGDEAVYTILGQKALAGLTPYADFYEMKPPLLYYIYGLGTTIFGWSAAGIRNLGFFIVILNSFLVFLTVKRFASIWTSFFIASISLFLMNNVFSYAVETPSEHFLISLVLGGNLLLLQAANKKSLVRIAIGGALIAGAALVKQPAAVFGLGALIFLIIESIRKNGLYKGQNLTANILALAGGAIGIFILAFLPTLLTGTFADAKYWIYDYPTTYVSSIPWSEGRNYMKTIGGWVFDYMFYTHLCLLLCTAFFLVNFKTKYYWNFLILFVATFLSVFPGFRFYGQYWIPFYLILPLSSLSIHQFVSKRIKWGKIVIPMLFLLVISIDAMIHRNSYFDSTYRMNSERAHNGNQQGALIAMIGELKKRIQPHETFAVYGPEAEAYIMLNKFPPFNHIYPSLISTQNERNETYQAEALKEYREASPDYAIYSLKSSSWRRQTEFDPTLYNNTFSFLMSKYQPLWIFNYDSQKFSHVEGGDSFDWSTPNQLFLLKRKK